PAPGEPAATKWPQPVPVASPVPSLSNSAQSQKPPWNGVQNEGLLQFCDTATCHSAALPYARATGTVAERTGRARRTALHIASPNAILMLCKDFSLKTPARSLFNTM